MSPNVFFFKFSGDRNTAYLANGYTLVVGHTYPEKVRLSEIYSAI